MGKLFTEWKFRRFFVLGGNKYSANFGGSSHHARCELDLAHLESIREQSIYGSIYIYAAIDSTSFR